MNLFKFDSLRKRYAAMTIILAGIMLIFAWYTQNQINTSANNIQSNIESRDTLLYQNRQIRNNITLARDLLYKFQIDPQNTTDQEFISKSIERAIHNIERLSEHSWIKTYYKKTVSDLIVTLTDVNIATKKLIDIRLTPQKLFPSLIIANQELQHLNATYTQNIQLAIKELEDNYTKNDFEEHQLLIDLRYNWLTMISNFRMYLLNQLNGFQKEYRQNQLDLITEFHDSTQNKLALLQYLNNTNKLKFTTTLALEQIKPAVLKWKAGFDRIKEINESEEWRTDIVVYQKELKPNLEKVNALLHTLDLGVKEFSTKDLSMLTKTAQLQVDAIWLATIIGMLILLLGFVFLVKLILNPISNVTHALKYDATNIDTNLQSNASLLETRNLITAFKEMRQQIHQRQEELEYHALHDGLTGLANRTLLVDRLEQAIRNSKQERSSFSILIMDLNRFKEINDTLGHSVGDKLLQKVAKRLITLLREVDVIVRLGGDEFAVLLTTAQQKQAELVSKKILNDFQNVFNVDKTPLYIGISIGISVFPQHGTTAQLLQQRADVAMYVAKRNKTGYEVYDQKYDEYSVGRLSLISDLRNAIDEKQLFMEYQPIINIKSGEVISAEALLRWNHPQRGKVFPDEIISIAEQTGLINPITYWIIDTTAKYNKRLIANGIDIKIAINLSVYNLQESDFVENIVAIYEHNDIPASSFIMEVTESVMMTNPEKSINVLNQLDKLGIEIAVDDFGTGYSSLAYLKQLPLSKLKIDKSFIMDMIDDDNDAMIVRSTIDLAHNLGMEVVAEGIEEKEMLELLLILGCELGQGYHMSRPISEDDFEKWTIEQNDKIHG